MEKHNPRGNWISLLPSRRAIALPVTFLMLFVSLTLLISATYYFSITKISAKTVELKISGAEQEMLSLEELIRFVSWNPGSYQIRELGDFGGKFTAEPNENRLILNLTDNGSFHDVFFNNTIGKVVYELPSSESSENIFLKGDSRAIVNQSSSIMAQFAVSRGMEKCELTLSYRPLVRSSIVGSTNGKPTNDLRVYIVNLNASEAMTRLGRFRLKVMSVNVISSQRSYDFTYPLTSLSVKAILNGNSGEVFMPVSSNSQGAIVNLETTTCYIKLEDAGW